MTDYISYLSGEQGYYASEPSTFNLSSWVHSFVGVASTSSPELPSFQSSRYASSSTSSDGSSQGARTPPTSPGFFTKHDSQSRHVHVVEQDEEDGELLPFTLSEEDLLHSQKLATKKPSSSAPPATVTLPLPPPTLTQPKRPRKPTREEEESRRGRSRWPRVLWRSELGEGEALEVLDAYHQRAVGGPLPVLKQKSTRRETKEWSRKMEEAGL